MFIIPILAVLAVGLLAASYAKNIKPAVTTSQALNPGRVYMLIVKNDQPGAPMAPYAAFSSMVTSGAFQGGTPGYVTGTLASDQGSYTFTFDWMGPEEGSFAWDSAFFLEDEGSIFIT
jgi:hypothetical protein